MTSKSLTITNSKITNIDPIRVLYNLEELDLSHNEIEDVRALMGLPHLKVLDLSMNERIADISFLGRITSLESLAIFRNKIESN